MTSCIEARFSHFKRGRLVASITLFQLPKRAFQLQDNLAKKNSKKKEELTVMYKKIHYKMKIMNQRGLAIYKFN